MDSSKETKEMEQKNEASGKESTTDDDNVKTKTEEEDDDDSYEIVEKESSTSLVDQKQPEEADSHNNDNDPQHHEGLWIGIDLGTSNCASAVWDSTRGRPKWMRLPDLAVPQSSKPGRIVPSAVQLLSSDNTDGWTPALLQDIQKWNDKEITATIKATVGHQVLSQLDCSTTTSSVVITSMKRVLGVCDTTNLDDLDPEFRASLPFTIEENEQGQWVIPYNLVPADDDTNSSTIIYLRPTHVAAMILQAIRQSAGAYLPRAIQKKNMQLPGMNNNKDNNNNTDINNVVIGVPAYFGHTQRQAVEEAARLAGFTGHVSTLTESTAAAMAYGLFVGQPAQDENENEQSKNAILVLDMGGGTTDITIAQLRNNNNNDTASSDRPDQKFQVILTDGDSRLGGEDMDQALLDLVLQKASSSNLVVEAKTPDLSSSQRQLLIRSCQQAKEELCGDVDHGDPPAETAMVHLPNDAFPTTMKNVQVTTEDLETAIQPLLERTAQLVERALKRYADKNSKSSSQQLIREVILIGGATRVPALRKLLHDRFFSNLELCTSVNAMSAVAQGTAIQAAILSNRVPLHELRSAMMLDTMPHAIGVLLPDERFVEILPRDSQLPANGYTTFCVADLDQKGVTVKAVEVIDDDQASSDDDGQTPKYQPLGDFTFLLHRLSDAQRLAIQNDPDRPGLRPVDIGMTLGTDGALQVSVFDSNDPDHLRKKEFYEKAKREGAPEVGFLDYVQAAADLQSDGITTEERKLLVAVSMLFVFYVIVKVLLPADVMSTSDEGLVRIV
ncbi:Heat shock 70 kDa protein (Fragment) [Seminavis robusta]|uniref:Heat shock 70 kDa protein n=1 Tax=Seminavis robusta TaxID=568900 RepID=A0A9N8DAE6_9STRA